MNAQKTGRKMKYGEPTIPVRIPLSMVAAVEELLAKREVLTSQWDHSLLPPSAQKLVDRIKSLLYETMSTPNLALLDMMRSSVCHNDDEIGRRAAHIDALETQLSELRRDLSIAVPQFLITSISDTEL